MQEKPVMDVIMRDKLGSNVIGHISGTIDPQQIKPIEFAPYTTNARTTFTGLHQQLLGLFTHRR